MLGQKALTSSTELEPPSGGYEELLAPFLKGRKTKRSKLTYVEKMSHTADRHGINKKNRA